MVCLESALGRNFDFRGAIALKKHQPPRLNDYEHRLLFEIINDCCNLTSKPEEIRLYLERGIELTGMNAAELSSYTKDLGFPELADAYKDFPKKD